MTSLYTVFGAYSISHIFRITFDTDVFRSLRALFGVGSREYMRSIGPANLLGNLLLGNLSTMSQLGSEGKSGSFFYFTADGRFMVKTLSAGEHKFFRGILPSYYEHMVRNPNSLLCRFMGLHQLRFSKHSKIGSQKLYFVVMANLFQTDLPIHRRFDLKGSWVGRRTKSHKISSDTCLKDLEALEQGFKIGVGEARREELLSVIHSDTLWLASQGVIDYSLLVGIHDYAHGDESAADATASGAGVGAVAASLTSDSDAANATTFTVSAAGTPVMCAKRVATAVAARTRAREMDTGESPFKSESGGMLSKDGSQVYFVGVIDFLIRCVRACGTRGEGDEENRGEKRRARSPPCCCRLTITVPIRPASTLPPSLRSYGSKKKMERMLRGYHPGVSVAPPSKYATRFNTFMDKIVE